jgi:phosphate uptake regulator
VRRVLNVDGLKGGMLMRELIACYVSGADEILLESPRIRTAQRQVIRAFTTSFIGFEVLEESAEAILLKSIVDVTKLPVRQTIEQMFMMTYTMFEDALRAVQDQDLELGESVRHRDADVDKLRAITTRRLWSLLRDKMTEEELGMSRLEMHYLESVATQIERIADHACKVAGTVMTRGSGSRNGRARRLKSTNEQMLQLLGECILMIRKTDVHRAHAILDASDAAEEGNRNLRSMTPADVILDDSLDRLRGYIRNMAEATIDFGGAMSQLAI